MMKHSILLYIVTIFISCEVCAAKSNYLKVNDITLWGDKIVISEKQTKRVTILSPDGTQRIASWSMRQSPTGVAVAGDLLYVTTFDSEGEVVVIDMKKGKIADLIKVGSGATSPTINAASNRLYVCNRYSTTIDEIDLKSRKVVRSVKAQREPCKAIYDQHRNKLYVANFLPHGDATREEIGASITIIDANNFEVERELQLATGSNALHGVALSPDGEFLLATHNLGRFQLPTTQLQQGWMNTSAMSIIDLNNMKYIASVLLDEPDRGAAGIWDIACNDKSIVISHSGVHYLSIVDYSAFKTKFINYEDKSSLSYDLRFMEGIRQQIAVVGNGPRNITITKDRAYVPTYFSDTLNIITLSERKVTHAVALVENRIVDTLLLGERYFNDATFCFQNWQSCNGCHPGDARTDALNWDLLNDGIGNPKNCKSLLYAHKLPPAMISGVRESSYLAVRTGFKFIQFHEIEEEYARCVDEYLLSLRPVASPYLQNGKLSQNAKMGKEIFERLKCDYCHSGEYYTDLKMHRIGEDVEFKDGWDTPTLCEVWRTAPYLFDGRASTMEEVFSLHKHGIREEITQEEIKNLTEYVNSL